MPTKLILAQHDREEIRAMPDAMLLNNIGSAERVLGDPKRFPEADVARVSARWTEMVAEATGRALFAVTQPNLGKTIPANSRRYPPGCPDPDWCRGNRRCYWDCAATDEEG